MRTALLAAILGGCTVLSPAAGPVRMVPGVGSVYRASQEEGERQLAAGPLALEDKFLYADGRWVDIGYDEQEDRITSHQWLRDRLVDAAEDDTIRFYHLHPPDKGGAVSGPSLADLVHHAALERSYPDKRVISAVIGPGVCYIYDTSDCFDPALFPPVRTPSPPTVGDLYAYALQKHVSPYEWAPDEEWYVFSLVTLGMGITVERERIDPPAADGSR
ncbi:MAG: hypothetical protein HY369_01015 [Candidatus Aenigmarchaeota archaeon]|nr:hypothetical protein [Candidatus Aenigmarchaeota archaeon]